MRTARPVFLGLLLALVAMARQDNIPLEHFESGAQEKVLDGLKQACSGVFRDLRAKGYDSVYGINLAELEQSARSTQFAFAAEESRRKDNGRTQVMLDYKKFYLLRSATGLEKRLFCLAEAVESHNIHDHGFFASAWLGYVADWAPLKAEAELSNYENTTPYFKEAIEKKVAPQSSESQSGSGSITVVEGMETLPQFVVPDMQAYEKLRRELREKPSLLYTAPKPIAYEKGVRHFYELVFRHAALVKLHDRVNNGLDRWDSMQPAYAKRDPKALSELLQKSRIFFARGLSANSSNRGESKYSFGELPQELRLRIATQTVQIPGATNVVSYRTVDRYLAIDIQSWESRGTYKPNFAVRYLEAMLNGNRNDQVLGPPMFAERHDDSGRGNQMHASDVIEFGKDKNRRKQKQRQQVFPRLPALPGTRHPF